MRRIILAVLLLAVASTIAHAQLTADQRVADLTQLANLYAKNYGPYEWKRDGLKIDILDLTPWLDRARDATNDLDFQDLLIEYVASFNDAHDLVAFPTTFFTRLPFSVDIYDGKVLIDSISRADMPIRRYPFTIGDELVSVDGKSVQDLIASFRKYSISANPRSTDRIAATRIVSRSQQIMPHAHEIGDTATIVVKRANGSQASYTVAWIKSGIPITSVGPTSSAKVTPPTRSTLTSEEGDSHVFDAANLLPFRWRNGMGTDDTLPPYMQPIMPLLNLSVPTEYYSVLGFGARAPVFTPPAGFIQRLGFAPADFFFSGLYVANGVRIGYLRIPSMSPPSTGLALQQLDQELAFFNAASDGLIVDVMRNPGGLVSFVESVCQRLIPAPFRTMGFEVRATGSWLFSFASQLSAAERFAPEPTVQNLNDVFGEVLRAYNENRGKTIPISLNSSGLLTLNPAGVVYGKPLMVLTDEFSASGGDMFPAIIQDNRRGPIFGFRSMGAGGSVVGYDGTNFTESFARVTVSLMNRRAPIVTTEFPAAPYVENIGVRPDVTEDYMTRQNLMNGGQTFVQNFTTAMVNYVRTGSPTGR